MAEDNFWLLFLDGHVHFMGSPWREQGPVGGYC